MAHAFSESLRRSLIATAAVLLLGTVGATCGRVVRALPDHGPDAGAAATPPSATPTRLTVEPAIAEGAQGRAGG